jgi:hypothetical protein
MQRRRFLHLGGKAALTIAVLASVYSVGQAMYPEARAPSSCFSGHRWTPPAVLPGRGVARPELTLGEGIAYGFGSAASGRAVAPPSPPAIFALSGGVAHPGAPSEAVGFHDPILAADPSGSLHAVWAEDEEGAIPDPSARFKQLWLTRVLHARYRAGEWSRASVIYRARKIPWQRPLISRLAVDGSGRLHLAFVAQRLTSAPPLVHLRSEAEGWSITEWTEWLQPSPHHRGQSGIDSVIPAAGGIYPALAVGLERRLYLAFVSPARFASGAPMPGGDSNSLWVKRSYDGGASWSAPILVHRSGSRGAYEPHILSVGLDTVHILWQKNLDDAAGPDAVWHAISADGGGTWSQPDAVPALGQSPFRNMRATVGPDGDLYLTFLSTSARDKRGEQILYSRRHGSAWSAPRPLRAELPVSGFDLTMDSTGRLHLLWSSVASARPHQREAVRTLHYSVGSPCQT